MQIMLHLKDNCSFFYVQENSLFFFSKTQDGITLEVLSLFIYTLSRIILYIQFYILFTKYWYCILEF